MPEEFGSSLGGTEDLIALLKQKQLQSPQQNLQEFLISEQDASRVSQDQSIPQHLVNKFGTQNMTDHEKTMQDATVNQMLPMLLMSQMFSSDDLLGKFLNKQGNREFKEGGADLMRQQQMKQLGFE
jgi:hypothetical protein|tara:strand:+ start:1587 stop:1964 length:378 start_codon:yes stop_codon:yes gene_type:complete